MQRASLTLYWTGSCRHPECTTIRGGGWRACEFPMFAAVVERGGELIVVDPGYSPRFLAATQPFPQRLYRWATPATCPPRASLAEQLKHSGLLSRVTKIVITHFHADHVAGLLDLPEVEVICSRAAWEDFTGRAGVRAVASGYLSALIPRAVAERIRFADDLPASRHPGPLAKLGDGRDLFGDGSIIMSPLPGHAAGQVGVAVAGHDGASRFLVADAAWSRQALSEDRPPPWLVQRFLGDPRAYMETWKTLRAVHAADPALRLVPSHCRLAAAEEGCVIQQP